MRALSAIAFFVALLGCCATTQRVPYTEEYPIGDWTADWGGDGEPKSLWIINPTGQAVHVNMVCISEHAAPWEVDLAPHQTERVLIQVLNRDQFFNDCSVTSWTPLHHAPHGLRRAVRR